MTLIIGKTFRSFVAAAVVLASVASARAETKDLASYGPWRVFGGTTEDGSPVCGTYTSWQNGAYFGVKYFIGQTFLTVQITKSAWRIPQGANVDVAIRFDDGAPWTAKASVHPQHSDTLIITVQSDKVASFVNQVRLANTIAVSFPSGTEAPWFGSMAGSNQAVDTMKACIDTVLANRSTPTQPFAVQPSQPFTPQPVQARGNDT